MCILNNYCELARSYALIKTGLLVIKNFTRLESTMRIQVNSEEELVSLLVKEKEIMALPHSIQVKSRYCSFDIYDSLIDLSLNFEPYISVARRCGMKYCSIMQSKKTNRFYVGYINNGGHASRCEIMPISNENILNPDYIESVYRDYALKINRAVDPELSYEI